MSLRYDENRQRIICCWEEPRHVVMNKKKGVIRRARMITVKVNNNGKLNNKDIRRHEDHPMFSYISRFNSMLNRIKSLPGHEGGHTCAACGAKEGVSPYYDVRTQSIIWLCREHLDDSPLVAA